MNRLVRLYYARQRRNEAWSSIYSFWESFN